MPKKIGWYRTRSDHWYWFDGLRLWYPNHFSERQDTLWIEPSATFSVSPSSILEALVVKGIHLRTPQPGDIFQIRAGGRIYIRDTYH